MTLFDCPLEAIDLRSLFSESDAFDDEAKFVVEPDIEQRCRDQFSLDDRATPPVPETDESGIPF